MTTTPPTPARDDGWGQDEPAYLRTLAATLTNRRGLGRVARLTVHAVITAHAARIEQGKEAGR